MRIWSRFVVRFSITSAIGSMALVVIFFVMILFTSNPVRAAGAGPVGTRPGSGPTLGPFYVRGNDGQVRQFDSGSCNAAGCSYSNHDGTQAVFTNNDGQLSVGRQGGKGYSTDPAAPNYVGNSSYVKDDGQSRVPPSDVQAKLDAQTAGAGGPNSNGQSSNPSGAGGSNGPGSNTAGDNAPSNSDNSSNASGVNSSGSPGSNTTPGNNTQVGNANNGNTGSNTGANTTESPGESASTTGSQQPSGSGTTNSQQALDYDNLTVEQIKKLTPDQMNEMTPDQRQAALDKMDAAQAGQFGNSPVAPYSLQQDPAPPAINANPPPTDPVQQAVQGAISTPPGPVGPVSNGFVATNDEYGPVQYNQVGNQWVMSAYDAAGGFTRLIGPVSLYTDTTGRVWAQSDSGGRTWNVIPPSPTNVGCNVNGVTCNGWVFMPGVTVNGKFNPGGWGCNTNCGPRPTYTPTGYGPNGQSPTSGSGSNGQNPALGHGTVGFQPPSSGGSTGGGGTWNPCPDGQQGCAVRDDSVAKLPKGGGSNSDQPKKSLAVATSPAENKHESKEAIDPKPMLSKSRTPVREEQPKPVNLTSKSAATTTAPENRNGAKEASSGTVAPSGGHILGKSADVPPTAIGRSAGVTTVSKIPTAAGRLPSTGASVASRAVSLTAPSAANSAASSAANRAAAAAASRAAAAAGRAATATASRVASNAASTAASKATSNAASAAASRAAELASHIRIPGH